ncbi:MAG: alpha-L-arabinofuranosidase C-terminal domain-containing protein [Acidobacteriota bacterium]
MSRTEKDFPLFILLLGLPCLVLLAVIPAPAQLKAKIVVDTNKSVHKIDRRIYGQYVEHFGRIVQGGLWAELLRNRKFYPIDAQRSQVAEPWQPEREQGQVSYVIDRSESIDGISSQRISLFGQSRDWRGIRQSGFDVLGGKEYVAYAWIKVDRPGQTVSFRLESLQGMVAAHAEATVPPGDWKKVQVKLTPTTDLRPAVFRLAFNSPGLKWIGAASLMPADNVEGLRRDVLELVKTMGPPIIRWPGGGYPDCYDWRKAIGPRDQRPPQDLLPFGQPYGYDNGMDPNDFGTDEYLRFCELIDAEPYITANFGSGTPEMAAAWVEYCNGPATSPWGSKRAANGRSQPYGVKHWSIGNEIWGDPFQSGHTTGEGYAFYFVPMAKAMRAIDPSIQITAVGHFDTPDRRAWNVPVIQGAWEQIDLLSLHHYYPGSAKLPNARNRPRDFYLWIVAEPTQTERGLREMLALVDNLTGGRKEIAIAFDEWNEWDWEYEFPVERPERSARNQFIDLINKSGLEFNHTARDGIFGARILHMLMRLADRVPIAIRTHMINSLGAIRTDSTRSFVTASGTVMQLYRFHSGSNLLQIKQEAPAFDVAEMGWKEIAYLDAAATLSGDGKTLYLHLINLHPDESLATQVEIQGHEVAPQGVAWQIAPEDFLSRNDFGISRVVIRRKEVQNAGASFVYQLPPHSVTTLEAQLK